MHWYSKGVVNFFFFLDNVEGQLKINMYVFRVLWVCETLGIYMYSLFALEPCLRLDQVHWRLANVSSAGGTRTTNTTYG